MLLMLMLAATGMLLDSAAIALDPPRLYIVFHAPILALDCQQIECDAPPPCLFLLFPPLQVPEDRPERCSCRVLWRGQQCCGCGRQHSDVHAAQG